MPKGIPEAARNLIAEHIESVAQLEVLLLLRGSPERVWAGAEVARELRTSAELADASLGRLSRAGLVRVEIDAEGRPGFQFAPSTRRLAAAAEELASAYSTHKTAVITLIFSGPDDSIQDFADAFRLRGDS